MAHDRTAPLESAVAALDAPLADGVVTSAAAQRLAVVVVVAGAIAAPPAHARVTHVGSPFAEIRRTLVEHQVTGTSHEPPTSTDAASEICKLVNFNFRKII